MTEEACSQCPAFLAIPAIKMRSLAQTQPPGLVQDSFCHPERASPGVTIYQDPVNALAEETTLKDSLCCSFTNSLLLNMDMVADLFDRPSGQTVLSLQSHSLKPVLPLDYDSTIRAS